MTELHKSPKLTESQSSASHNCGECRGMSCFITTRKMQSSLARKLLKFRIPKLQIPWGTGTPCILHTSTGRYGRVSNSSKRRMPTDDLRFPADHGIGRTGYRKFGSSTWNGDVLLVGFCLVRDLSMSDEVTPGALIVDCRLAECHLLLKITRLHELARRVPYVSLLWIHTPQSIHSSSCLAVRGTSPVASFQAYSDT